ncbi:MAG: hypothetical protein LBC75_09235 [Fibromonadaceae bacterium]|jgi:hypothetical protein|nr:hypothetical protein [Fibromonadaceae bacterium]
MKKEFFVFLCVAAALFFGSCADLSVNEEEAVKADLPADFDAVEYGKINGDVIKSQIILDLKTTKKGVDSITDCVNIFSSDSTFAKYIYEDHLLCPVDGWDKKEKCTGKYANNSNYNKPVIDTTYSTRDSTYTLVDSTGTPRGDTTITIIDITTTEYPSGCAIENCLSGGWGELKNSLSDNLGIVKAMCLFVRDTTLEEAKKYLNNFKPDPYLVEQHYHFFGRSDGRPYKYCDKEHGVEKTQSLAIRRENREGYYYDYGKYTFCLDKTNEKIYVVK